MNLRKSESFLATVHELCLKGANRGFFERALDRNIHRVLAGLPIRYVSRDSSRVLLSFREPVDEMEVARRMWAVFGIKAIYPVSWVEGGLDEIASQAAILSKDVKPGSFAVRCKRSDKSFPATSPEIEKAVGKAVAETGRKVNLSSPDITIRVFVVRGGAWIALRRYKGPGGLPSGTGGKLACLLSGGIDSPVAAWLVARRGAQIRLIHFHSAPMTDPASIEKVRRIASILACYHGETTLALVPLLDIQQRVVQLAPERSRVLLSRRFMLRIAERLASTRQLKADALVTGESLGQVASQTVENLTAVEAACAIPILRPLIGLDKDEITSLAKRAGTYKISVEPHFDCCSYMVPAHPATKSTPNALEAAEKHLPVAEMVEDAVAKTEIEKVEAAGWDEIPVPEHG